MNPSATSPASALILAPTPASSTGGGPYGLGPGLKNGVISVCE